MEQKEAEILRKVLTPAQKLRLAAQQKYLCAQCDTLLPSTWQVDHFVPLHKGGSNEWENLQVLCPNCHADKTQLEAIERESVARRNRKRGGPSPYFGVGGSDAVAIAAAPPPFVLRRRCRQPTVSISYFDP